MTRLAINKRATYDYEIIETFEAGLMLTGQEVKSAKGKNISLKGSFVAINHTGPGGQPEVWLLNCHISPYKFAGDLPHYEPTRSRKLLLNKKEIESLIGKTKQQGLTLVPLSMYTKKSLVKVSVGLAKGKRQIDKRQTIQKRESDRQIGRLLRHKR